MPNDVLNRRIIGSPNATLKRLLDEALIPTRNGIVTPTTSACVDPISGASIPSNTVNGRTLNVGPYSFVGAALRAERATTGVCGAASVTFSNLASNTTAAGDYPIQRTIVEDSANAGHITGTPAFALTNSVNYVISIYVKRGVGSRNLTMYVDATGTDRAGGTLDISTGAIAPVTNGTASVVRSSARLLSTGWWLFQITITATAWGANPTLYLRMSNTTVQSSYLGDGVSSLVTSALQCELGEYATMPLAWDGSAGVSRVAQLNSWNQALSLTAGTVVAVKMNYGWSDTFGPANPRMYNANNNGILWYTPSTQSYKDWRVDTLAANNQATSAATPSLAGVQQIVTQRFDAASNRITVKGATVSSAAPTLPFAAATPLIIGNDAALGNPADGWVSLLLFNRALTDAEEFLLRGSVRIS